MSTTAAACPSCGSAYALPGACPHCRELLLRRRNLLASLLAVAAGAILVYANWLPFLTVRQFGSEHTYTIVGGSLDLFDRGNALLGGAIFVFSFLFPFVKLLLLLAAGLVPALPLSARRTLRDLTRFIGKWSMLDVFVVATLIVIIKMGDTEVIRGIMDVQAGPAVPWFCIAVLLSGVAGFCMAVPTSEATPPVPPSPQPAPVSPTRRRRSPWLAGLAGLVLLCGGLAIALLLAPSRQDVAVIRAIRLSDASILPPVFSTTYDLYLELDTPAGPVRTNTEREAILGNGLTFPLPQPIPFRDIRAISAWDARESSLWDKVRRRERLDQVNEFGFEAKGSRFRFTLVPTDEIPWPRYRPLIAGYTLAGLGVLLLLLAALRPPRP